MSQGVRPGTAQAQCTLIWDQREQLWRRMPWCAGESPGQTGHCYEFYKRARPQTKSRMQQQNNQGSFPNGFPPNTVFKNAKINDTGISWVNHWTFELLPSKTRNVKTSLTTCHCESRAHWLQQTLQMLIWGMCPSTSSKWPCTKHSREDCWCHSFAAKLKPTRRA